MITRPTNDGRVSGARGDGPISGSPVRKRPAYKRSSWMLMIVLPVTLMLSVGLLLSGCGRGQASAGRQAGQPAGDAATAGPAADHAAADREPALPSGVMSAARACQLVVGKAGSGFLIHPERVHLVLTSYAKGEPVESQGDISSGMPPRTLVWVVEVHAKAIHWDHSEPPPPAAPAIPGGRATSGGTAPTTPPPDTDFSVVLNARTGYVSDQGECTCWPLALGKVGALVSLPPTC